MLAVYASPPPSPAVDARLTIGLRAADFPDRTFTGKSTSALHGAPRFVPLSRSWGLGSNGTEKAVKPLRAYFVLASSLRLAAQARHAACRKTYRETSDFC